MCAPPRDRLISHTVVEGSVLVADLGPAEEIDPCPSRGDREPGGVEREADVGSVPRREEAARSEGQLLTPDRQPRGVFIVELAVDRNLHIRVVDVQVVLVYGRGGAPVARDGRVAELDVEADRLIDLEIRMEQEPVQVVGIGSVGVGRQSELEIGVRLELFPHASADSEDDRRVVIEREIDRVLALEEP